MIKKNESFFIAITLVLSVMIMNNREAYPGNISINVQDGNAEITAMGGKSNVHVVRSFRKRGDSRLPVTIISFLILSPKSKEIRCM
jgi:hypothetical protein